MPRKKIDHDSDVLRGMARGPWAVHWADREEERGITHSQEDLYEVAPEAPRWAQRWARDLADKVVEVNGGASLADLYQLAVSEGFARDEESLGFYLGMQATGAGVRWDDDLRGTASKIRVPSCEFYQGARPDLRFVSE
jgi:hypothetical protein